MKIFAVIPARNDAWVLPRVLGTASLWADHIIVADENSWDNTDEVCKQFPKVQMVKFEPKEFNESNRRQVLLEAVRQYDGQNLVFGLDSDEILSAEALNKSVMENFISQLKPGMSAKFQWIMLWKNVNQYRYDQDPAWSANFKHFAYWDDRKINFENVKMHSARVPDAILPNNITFHGFKVLHYNFADWERCLAKHVYYLALEKTMGSKAHPYILDRKYHWYEKVGKGRLVVKSVPSEWVKPYQEQGIDMGDFKNQDLYWYDAEVLRFFQKYGIENFRHYNIWQTNWEQKRQLALAAGERELPQKPIKNLQPWYDNFYYKYIAPKTYQM